MVQDKLHFSHCSDPPQVKGLLGRGELKEPSHCLLLQLLNTDVKEELGSSSAEQSSLYLTFTLEEKVTGRQRGTSQPGMQQDGTEQSLQLTDGLLSATHQFTDSTVPCRLEQ